MGIKNEIGVELFETANFPVAVTTDGFETQKIVDFELSEDLMIL
jgi:hypothetical protein